MKKTPCRCGRFEWPHRRTWDCVDHEERLAMEREDAADELREQQAGEWAAERGRVARAIERGWP